MHPDGQSFLHHRKLPARPETFDETNRSVRVVAAAETPIRRIDPVLKAPVAFIHLVEGVILPENGQVPLLDSHNWSSISALLGSARNFQVIGHTLECDVFFSDTRTGKSMAQTVKEGHLTDFSVGYQWDLKDTELIPKGAVRTIAGRPIRGLARVIKKWHLLELSAVMKGADPLAKARGEPDHNRWERAETRRPTASGPARSRGLIDWIFWSLALFMAASFIISLLTS